jgi:hypothetical protein
MLVAGKIFDFAVQNPLSLLLGQPCHLQVPVQSRCVRIDGGIELIVDDLGIDFEWLELAEFGPTPIMLDNGNSPARCFCHEWPEGPERGGYGPS